MMNESDQYWTRMYAKMQRDGGLTMAERGEIRERYMAEQMKTESFTAKKGQVLSKEDPLNMPRHLVPSGCQDFQECPLCFKCRSYDSSHLACRDCPLGENKRFVCKKEIHTEQVLEMMIRRERIDLDDDDYK